MTAEFTTIDIHGAAGRLALFLDVDGTLLEIAPSPDSVHVPARLRHSLALAAKREAGALALVSGRHILDLDSLFHPAQYPAAGVHGLVRRDAAGRWITPAIDRSILLRVRATFEDFAQQHPGILIEDKQCAIAVHYRQAPHCRAAVLDLASALTAELGPAIRSQTGKCVVELKPYEHSKRTAIEAFMREPPFCGRVPVFIGDDDTDEDGFAAVNEQNGVSIRVGYASPTMARWRFGTVNEVIRWLAAPHLPAGRRIMSA